MAYTRNWSESNPQDHLKFNQTSGQIRDVRADVAERLKNLLYGFISGETQTTEGVKNLPFYVQGSDPGATADKIKAYAKDISSKAELHLQDEDGNVIVVTRSGKLAIDSVFRSSDLLMTASSTVPTNFTDITSTYSDRYLRVGSTGLATGGSSTHTHGVGSYASADHSHSMSNSGVTGGSYRASTTTGGAIAADGSHTHNDLSGGGAAITGTSGSGNNAPLYVDMKVFQRD